MLEQELIGFDVETRVCSVLIELVVLPSDDDKVTEAVDNGQDASMFVKGVTKHLVFPFVDYIVTVDCLKSLCCQF